MSRFQDLCVFVLARLGVDPAADGLSGRASSSESATSASPPAPSCRPTSPYHCVPTRWGDEEVTAAVTGESSPPIRSTSISYWPTRVDRPKPKRGPRRRKLEVDREPPPRGLMMS